MQTLICFQGLKQCGPTTMVSHLFRLTQLLLLVWKETTSRERTTPPINGTTLNTQWSGSTWLHLKVSLQTRGTDTTQERFWIGAPVSLTQLPIIIILWLELTKVTRKSMKNISQLSRNKEHSLLLIQLLVQRKLILFFNPTCLTNRMHILNWLICRVHLFKLLLSKLRCQLISEVGDHIQWVCSRCSKDFRSTTVLLAMDHPLILQLTTKLLPKLRCVMFLILLIVF